MAGIWDTYLPPHLQATSTPEPAAATSLIWAVVGVLLVLIFALIDRPKVLGRATKPILFAVLAFATLLGLGALSDVRRAVVSSFSDPSEAGLLIGVMYAGFVAVIGYLARSIWRRPPEASAPAAPTQPTQLQQASEQESLAGSSVPQTPADVERARDVYEVIADELDSGNTDRSLWTRLYADNDGDEVRTRVAYIKARAAVLQR